jgi:protein ImuB
MYACLYVPDFPCQAALLAQHADARDRFRCFPAVVLDGPPSLLKVVALNDSARKTGIKLEMTKLQVETCGGISIHKREAKHETVAQAHLLECANRFSPRVESASAGIVLLDLSGTETLFGPLGRTARKISHDARGRGFVLHLAIASNPDAALYGAKGLPGIAIIPAGREGEVLSQLSVDLLPTTPEIRETLKSWGIHTFGALAKLPQVALVARLGQAGLHLQQLAQGRVMRALLPIEPPTKFIESYEFDDPVETVESLTFVLNRLLHILCTKLLSNSLATNELRLTLQLEVRQRKDAESDERYDHSWKLPFPTEDRNVLFALINLDLQRQNFSAPIKRVVIEAVPIKPRRTQSNLFAPPTPEAEKLEITLSRIRGIVGGTDASALGCAGTPKIADTYKPDSFAIETFSTVSASTGKAEWAEPLTLRVFRPALETIVELTDAKPHFVHLWHRHRRVIASSGPWSISGTWWNRAMAWAREEWDIALKTPAGIGLYRIYRDEIGGQWFVEGMFD